MEVDYLPDSGGPIVKNGHSKMVPSTKVNPIREVQGPLPNTNIRRTRSRVKIAIWISIIAMITVLGFFVMGVVWLWQIEQREYEQADTIDNLEREIGDERLTIEQLKKAVEGSRSINIHEVNPCFLPKLVGACKKAELKWYYDQEARKCQQFKYGGCEGNKNNFESKAECQEMCAVSAAVSQNDNDNVNDNDIDIVNDNDNDEDINNKNQDVAIDDSNPCDLSMDVGHCRAAFPRFYFDKETGNCKKFIYGGCAGNSNNFETLDECQARCKPTKPKQNEPTKPNQPTKPNDEVCNLEPESGMCRGAYERYFYDKKTESCKQFNWGGCSGNGNNFETKIACRKACPEGRNNVDLNPDAICSLPSRTGTCRAAMQRYFYNAQTLKCELFIYGGCEGNDNNFKTEEECRSFCSGN